MFRHVEWRDFANFDSLFPRSIWLWILSKALVDSRWCSSSKCQKDSCGNWNFAVVPDASVAANLIYMRFHWNSVDCRDLALCVVQYLDNRVCIWLQCWQKNSVSFPSPSLNRFEEILGRQTNNYRSNSFYVLESVNQSATWKFL